MESEPMTPSQKVALDDHNSLLRRAGHEELQFPGGKPSGPSRNFSNKNLHPGLDQGDDAQQFLSPDREYQPDLEATLARRPKTRRRRSRSKADPDSSSSSTSPPRSLEENKAKNKGKLLTPRNPGSGSQPSSQSSSRTASRPGAERGTRAASQETSPVPQRLIPPSQQPSNNERSQTRGRGRPAVGTSTSALGPTPSGTFPIRSSSLQHSTKYVPPASALSGSHKSQSYSASDQEKPRPRSPLVLSTPRTRQQNPGVFDTRRSPTQEQPSGENIATSDDGLDYQASNPGSPPKPDLSPSSIGTSRASSDALPPHSAPLIRPKPSSLEHQLAAGAEAQAGPRSMTFHHDSSAVDDGEGGDVQVLSAQRGRKVASSPALNDGIVTIHAYIREVTPASPGGTPRNPGPLRRIKPMRASNETASSADEEDSFHV